MLYHRLLLLLWLALFVSGCGVPDSRSSAPAAGSASSASSGAAQPSATPAAQVPDIRAGATPAPASAPPAATVAATPPPPPTPPPDGTAGTAEQQQTDPRPTGEPVVEQTPLPAEGVTPILPSGQGSAATAELIIVEPATAGPVLTPTPLYRTATIRMEHTMQTLELRVGDAFVLQLGHMLWQFEEVDRAVLQPVEDALGRADVQAAYQAVGPGQALLQATGDPPCINAQPACMMPSLMFQLTVIVHP